MKCYLVGGAVRDKLLGLAVKERDWVVIGSDPKTMIDAGYKPVGKHFPVFLEPQTHEEYALARTERKQGHGYQGFLFNTDKNITLEQDLSRRDLTINAIAETETGELIDPFNGQQDIKNQVLRHVSDAFVEDPLRAFRVARFAARFNFKVADQTMEYMRDMVKQDEIKYLSSERVWIETQKALSYDYPENYITVLKDCGALDIWLPEIEDLFGVPQPEKYHPEIDTGIHTIMVLAQAAKLSSNPMVRFAALLHDLGKALTPKNKLPSHHDHGQRGLQPIETLCQRLKVPKKYRELALVVSQYHIDCHRIHEMKPATILKKLEGIDALRRPDRFEMFLTVCEADFKGRKGFENRSYTQRDYLKTILKTVQSVDHDDLPTGSGELFKQQLRKKQIHAIKQMIKQ